MMKGNMIKYHSIYFMKENINKKFLSYNNAFEFFSDKCVPWNAILQVTNRCHQNCIHCYQVHEDDFVKVIKLENLKNVIDDLKKLGTTYLTLTGGEASLRTDFFNIIEYALEVGFKVIYLSNGQLSEDTLRKLLKYKNRISVEISIHGLHEVHDNIVGLKGAFDNALRASKYLYKNGIDVKVVSVVINQNYDSIEYLDKFLVNQNLPWKHSPIIYDDKNYKYRLNDTNLFEYYLKYPEELTNIKKCNSGNNLGELSCDIARTTIMIDTYGNIYPCNWYNESIGNVLEDDICSIWNGSKADLMRSTVCYGAVECKECKYKQGCKRCSAYALCENGTYELAPKEWCRIMKIQEEAYKYEKEC